MGGESLSKDTVVGQTDRRTGGTGCSLTIRYYNYPPETVNLTAKNKTTISFGRDDANDIVVPSRIVSRSHGYFMLEGENWYIVDNGSTNGIYVNNERVSKALLNDGDQIRIDNIRKSVPGKVTMTYSDSDSSLKWDICNIGEKGVTVGNTHGSKSQVKVDISFDDLNRGEEIYFTLKKSGSLYYRIDSSDSSEETTVKINGIESKTRTSAEISPGDAIICENGELKIEMCITEDNRLQFRKYKQGYSLELLHVQKFVKYPLFTWIGNIFKGVKNKIFSNGGKEDSRKRSSNQKNGSNSNYANRYPKARYKKLLDETSLLIKQGEFVAVVGGSGCGKSTLLNCINGFEQPDGHVFINNRELYENYNELKGCIGYVPQQDIVHENLTLKNMLKYAARLKLGKWNCGDAISKAIATVGLEGHENQLIRKMSGGQKKRASIAMELLSDPGILFMDEPSSGLDPGTERSLMDSLRDMSTMGGKTIVMVTHNTNNIHLCDKLLFLGTGGYVCFYGAPEDALSFFRTVGAVDDLTDVYGLVESTPDAPRECEENYNKSGYHLTDTLLSERMIEKYDRRSEEVGKKKRSRSTVKSEKKGGKGKSNSPSFFYQMFVLAQRYIKLILNDRVRFAILMLQGPFIALIASLVSVENTFKSYYDAQAMLFILSCAAVWVGLFNSVQEVCKERSIIRREYMAGMKLGAYMCSKLLVLTLLSIVQCALMLVVFKLTIGLPESGVLFGSSFVEMLITLVLVVMASSSMGLLLSSCVKNADKAMAGAPFLLIPQVIFSGILFTLDGVKGVISWFCVSRWAMQAMSNTANLNGILWNMLSLKYSSEEKLQSAYELNYNALYAHSVSNLFSCWGVLLLFIAVLSAISILVLHRVKHDKR